jgi:uncharacterized surface protein with fasciclin (FAS1) repeats
LKKQDYTIFVPSDQAISDFRLDTLSKSDLADILSYHFIRGEKIFTDNKKYWMDYETLRKDESSTQYTTYYSSMNIRPGPDVIDILDGEGNLYVSAPEEKGITNVLVAYDTDKQSLDDTDFIISIVVHRIDRVLDPSILKK